MREWSSPYPAWVYLALLAGFLCLIVLARRTAISDRLRSWWLFAPRLIVLGLLLGVLMNPVERREHRLPDQPAQVLFLVDASRSMALEEPASRALQIQQTMQRVDARLRQQATPPRLQLFRFGRQLASVSDVSQLRPVDPATRLAEALEQLPSRFARELPRGVVVISDGVVEDEVRLGDVAEYYRSAGIPIHVFPVGDSRVRGDVAIDELVVPRRADVGTKVPLRGVVRGSGFAGERVVVQVRASDRPQLPPLASLPMTLAEGPQPFELVVEVNPDHGDLVLEIPPLTGEVTSRNNRVPFKLPGGPRKLKVLYMEGTTDNEYRWVHDALMEDEDIDCVSLVVDHQYVQRPRLIQVDDPYRGFPATREELLQFDCVICSDISIGAFTPEQLDWTVELVGKHGGGFVMVGGITSFGAGGWDQTVWDQLIPVDMTGGQIGRGWLYHTFRVRVPEEAHSHPIWRIVEDPAQNRRVLEAMPAFLGTNYIQRLKPAATLLGESATPIPQAGIMPIFASQPYGRGRTFAFASDTTVDWGRYFESQWGEGDNRYFRRFWRNVVRWLCENSASGNRRLQLETDRVIYRSGQPIRLLARTLDEQLVETVEYQLTATAKPQAAGAEPTRDSITLTPDSAGTFYTGEIDTSFLESASDDILAPLQIEVVAEERGTEVARATADLMILPDLDELLQPRARPEVLERLAEATGGQRLDGTEELVSLLWRMPAESGDSIVSRQPLWDSTWLWSLLVGLLAVEWVMRRRSG
jgi:uncharacterized membrane protein